MTEPQDATLTDDLWAAVTIGLVVLALGGVLFVSALYPALSLTGPVARWAFLLGSAVGHTLTATWIHQAAPTARLARVVGSLNASMALVDLFALWVLQTQG